jgi:hypothetical protein
VLLASDVNGVLKTRFYSSGIQNAHPLAKSPISAKGDRLLSALAGGAPLTPKLRQDRPVP